jgi:hypothetical protein
MHIDLDEALEAFRNALGLVGKEKLEAVITAGRLAKELDRERGVRSSSTRRTNLQALQQEVGIRSRTTIARWIETFEVSAVDPARVARYARRCEVNDEPITAKGFRDFYNPPKTAATPEELTPRSAWSVPLSAKDQRRIEFKFRALDLDYGKEFEEFLNQKYAARLAERCAA